MQSGFKSLISNLRDKHQHTDKGKKKGVSRGHFWRQTKARQWPGNEAHRRTRGGKPARHGGGHRREREWDEGERGEGLGCLRWWTGWLLGKESRKPQCDYSAAVADGGWEYSFLLLCNSLFSDFFLVSLLFLFFIPSPFFVFSTMFALWCLL